MLQRFLNQLASFGGTAAPKVGSAAFAKEEADRLIGGGDKAGSEGKLREACELYRKAVNVSPGYAKAHLNLGIALEAMRDADGAIRSYEAALALDPENAYASYNFGKLLYTLGELPRAEELLSAALKHRPEFPEAHVVLSSVLEARGNLSAAAGALEVALKQRPDWAGALFNFGMVLKTLGRLGEAEAALSRVTTLDPKNADACYELGNLLYERGALQEAEKLLRLALEHKSESQEAHRKLFYLYDALGDDNSAATVLEAALKHWPDWDDALRHYGAALKKLQRPTEAEAVLRRAIAVSPEISATYQALGTVLMVQSRIAEALDAFGAARELDPHKFELESSELFALNFSDDISCDALFEKHRAFGIRLERAYPTRFQPFRNVRQAERRLCVGYVSGDFSFHAVSLFVIPLLERHDRNLYEIYCYSVGRPSEKDSAVRSRTDHWREAGSMSDAELAGAVNADGIDILVDLSGHSGQSRLGTFAQRPAPVQVTWLGYLNTTGTTRIQYRLSDRHADPVGFTDHLHTETLVRLPNSQWCYRPLAIVDTAEAPPFERNGYVTFGSFNQTAKLSPSVRMLWAEILKRLPDARLTIVGVPDADVGDSLVRYFENAGIASTRVSVVPRLTLEEYFRCFNGADIALDTFPYSGGTTTCDALWMGVPVLTVPGSRSVSRSTASILSTLGLSEWIASTPEDYVRLAIQLARERAVLTKLRATLRQRMRESPLMDEVRFARDIEDAYRQMWTAWCSDHHV